MLIKWNRSRLRKLKCYSSYKNKTKLKRIAYKASYQIKLSIIKRAMLRIKCTCLLKLLPLIPRF